MTKSPPRKTPKNQTRYGGKQDLPSMATPRKPEPKNKPGFMGFLFFIGVLSGLVWLLMMIFGWGPYATALAGMTPTATLLTTLEGAYLPSAIPTGTDIFFPTSTAAPEITPTVTLTSTPELRPYILIGEQETMSSDLVRPNLACSWLVIAGQVWDLQDAPVTGLTLHLYGELGGYAIDRYELSGSAEAYGESGYEFALENLLVDSMNSLFIQLVDNDGLALSHPYSTQTFNDCQQNLVMVNFKQVRQ